MREQSALTIVTRIITDRQASLRQLLATVAADPADNAVLPLRQFDDLHFARLAILDAVIDLRGVPIPAQLVFSGIFDGTASAALESLLLRVPGGLDSIFAHCEGYPDPAARTAAARRAYFDERRTRSQIFYVNTIGRTRRQVDDDARLRDAVERFLDAHDWREHSAADIAHQVRDFVHARPEGSPSSAQTGPDRWFRLRSALLLGGVAILALIASPVLLLGLPVWTALLLWHERRDPSDLRRPDPARLHECSADEDHLVQNQLSAIGFAKPGWFRWMTLRAVLWLVNLAARHVYNRGQLSGITTIHFAQWILLDDDRRLFFASNYDGSLESYMNDFVDRVAWGLNAVFSNGVGYPRTRLLVLGGARDEQAFKRFLRVHQIRTQVWHAAYPHLTAINLGNNARLRAGLVAQTRPRDPAAWLRYV
jgi:hypothetical protein